MAKQNKSQKSVKATSKQLAAITRQLKRDSRQSSIERLLGEEFESLAEAERELKRSTVQVKRTGKALVKSGKQFESLLRQVFSPKQKTGSKSAPKQKRNTALKQSSVVPPRKLSKPQPQPTSKPKLGSKRTPAKKTPGRIASVKYVAGKEHAYQIPLPKEPTPVHKKNQVFSTRPLKGRKGETTMHLFERLQNMGESPDSLLKPGERWSFTYGKGRAKRLYGTFQQAVNRMQEYQLTQGLLSGKIDPDEDDIESELVTSIKFVKTGETPSSYLDKKEKEEKLREAERKRIQRASAKQLDDSGIDRPSVFGGSIDLLDAQSRLLNDPAALRRRLEMLEKEKGK